MAENDPQLPVEGNVINIGQSTIQEATLAAEDVVVTRSIIDEMSNAAESVNIEGHINQVTVATTEANIVGATIETLNYIVQGGGDAQVPLVEDDSPLCKRSKIELISPEDLHTFINTCDEEIKFTCEGRMDVTEGYKDHINEPSHEFSSYFEIIKRFFEGYLGSRRVQLKPEEAATFKRTESSEEAFQYEKLTETILRSEKRVVAILGSAGAGKTMLSKRIIRDLCKSKETQELVLFKYFRDFSDEKEITLSHLLFGGLFEDDSMETKGYKWLLKNQDKAILILDGLDQRSILINSKAKRINQHGKGKALEIISNIFRGDLLPKVKIVYTSREHAVASLEEKCRPDMVIMMTGLSQIDVESLFISLVGDKGKDLWHKLVSQSHSLVPFLSTPLFVIFAAIVYKTSTGEPPQFVTGLMLEILELFKESDHISDRNIAKIMGGLEKMAFDGLQQNMVLFMVKHVERVGLHIEEIIDWMIKVPGRIKLNQYLLEGTDRFFFSNHSIQEILGGCYVSKLPLPKFVTVVHEYLPNDHWSLTLRFVSGILFNKETEEYRANIGNVQEKQEVLKVMLTTKYKTARSSTEKLAVLAAISESNDKEFIQSVVDSIKIYNYPISAAGMHVIGSILRHCQLLENLVLEKCSLDDTTANILWQCVSGKDCNVQVKILNLGVNKLSDAALSSAGHIIKNDGELYLYICSLTSSGLEHLQTALGGKKVKKLDFEYNKLSDVALSSVGNIIQNDGELILEGCSLTSSGLENLKIALDNKKISRLNVCENTIGLELASILGEITKHSSVDHLRMEYCSLTDSELEKFLFEAEGSELLYLNVYGNSITRPAIEQIRKSIKVEKIVDDFDSDKSHRLPPRIIEIQKSMKEYGIQKDDQLAPEPILGAHGGKPMHDADQPTTHAYGKTSAAAKINEDFLSDQAEAAKLDEVIRECVSASYIKGELIGPEGGSINVSDCKANYPPNAFQKKTPVRHSVRSSYDDAPEGFAVCSPELECRTFGVPFKGSVTITLPLHIIPENGQVVILKKKGYNSPWIQFQTCRVNEKDKTVSFQVSHFCSWIAAIGKMLGRLMGKVYLCHYLFYKLETCQLISLTCIDNSGTKTKFVTTYAQKGFIEALPQPEKIVLNSDECMTYRYRCLEPTTCTLLPIGDISIKRSVVEEYFYRLLYLSPNPPPATDRVVIQYVIKPPQQDVRESVAVLEWKTQKGASVLTDEEETEETAAEGGIVPGGGESVHGSLLGGAEAMETTVVKQICQASGEYNPAVLTGNEQDDGTAFAENEMTGNMSVQEPEGNVATGVIVPGGSGSVEESLLGEAGETEAMMSGDATAVKQLWTGGGNVVVAEESELSFCENAFAGGAAVAQHELAETVPVQETQASDDTFMDVDSLTEASGAVETEGNAAATGIPLESTGLVVGSVSGEATATEPMMTSSATVLVEETWPGTSTSIPQMMDVRRCGREFYEHHLTADNIYSFPRNRPKGKVLIIDNNFRGQGDRWQIPGTEVDIRKLETLWRKLGFNADVKENLTAEQMRFSCEEFARNTRDVSSVFLMILSHGGIQQGKECIYGNDRQMVQRERIISYFTTRNFLHLTGIPKVFMFEACRGSFREEYSVRAGAVSPLHVAPGPEVDMLMVYPSLSGHVSFYDRRRGSRLVEAFVYVFSHHAHDTHVLDMLTLVNHRMAGRVDLPGYTQTSNQENYLTKKLYLFPGWPG